MTRHNETFDTIGRQLWGQQRAVCTEPPPPHQPVFRVGLCVPSVDSKLQLQVTSSGARSPSSLEESACSVFFLFNCLAH